jgi:glycosyltransferase involved in cell wall biosynthesis
MIKFAILTPGLGQPGGAERVILSQIRYSDPARMRCTGIALDGHGGFDEALGNELLRYTTIHGDLHHGPWSRPASSKIKTDYPDLNTAVKFVCQEADVLIVAGWAYVKSKNVGGLGLPVIYVSHCCDAADMWKIGGITHLVAVSEAARQHFDGNPGVSELPITVIPNGIEVDRACPRRGRAWQRAQWGVSDSDKVLLYLGRHAHEKNPRACVRALAVLPPDYKLVMVGNQAFNPNEPSEAVASMVTELGIQDRVKFVPPTPYVGDVLAGADCLLHLSIREADSLVVKEAFMAGLPVVHTPVGSIPEMEAEFGPVGWGVGFRPGQLTEWSVDASETAVQIKAATNGDSRLVTNKMRAIAWERWTGAAMCERWANYLEGIVTK